MFLAELKYDEQEISITDKEFTGDDDHTIANGATCADSAPSIECATRNTIQNLVTDTMVENAINLFDPFIKNPKILSEGQYT